MKNVLMSLLLFAFLTACQETATHDDTHEGMQEEMHNDTQATTADAGTQPMMENGMQVINITVETLGYTPETIELKAGVPAKLIFTRETESACAEQIQIPDFGVEVTDLPLHEPVAFEFTPEDDGDYTFACGMNMMKGTIVVKS